MALPKMQFIVSTHSPTVTGTVEPENMLLVRRKSDEGGSCVEKVGTHTHGLTSDQILMSGLFGLRSTRAPAFEKRLREAAADVTAGKPGAAERFMRLSNEGSAGDARNDEPECRR